MFFMWTSINKDYELICTIILKKNNFSSRNESHKFLEYKNHHEYFTLVIILHVSHPSLAEFFQDLLIVSVFSTSPSSSSEIFLMFTIFGTSNIHFENETWSHDVNKYSISWNVCRFCCNYLLSRLLHLQMVK